MHHIGVFDSGLGGLTVLKELVTAMPGESFVYLGDLARLPYGTKSPEMVTEYATRCLALLEARGVKGIVVACNTATASALPALQRASQVPVWGVVESGVSAGLAATKLGRILVLATEGTVRSRAYLRAFESRASHVRVEQVACPLLVPLVEEGWFDTEVTRLVLADYLSRAESSEYDVVLLGCTHYPLLEPSLRRLVRGEVAIVHGARTLAETVRAELEARGALAVSLRPSVTLLATDRTESSSSMARRLFGGKLSFELVSLP